MISKRHSTVSERPVPFLPQISNMLGALDQGSIDSIQRLDSSAHISPVDTHHRKVKSMFKKEVGSSTGKIEFTTDVIDGKMDTIREQLKETQLRAIMAREE